MIRRLLALALAASAVPCAAQPIAFPEQFDPIGTPVQSLKTSEGRTVHYTDTGPETGEAGWRPMLFIGGVGTSARAPELVAFLHATGRVRANDIELHDDDATVRAVATYTDHTEVPLIGVFLPDVTVQAEVVMAVEPP